MSFASMSNRRVTAYRGRRVRIEFEMDRAGFRKIAMSDEIRDATTKVVVERAKPYAIAISPYDKTSKGPHYRDSFRVTQGSEIIVGLRRVATRLHNISPQSTLVEWHNGSRVLRRTLAFLNHDSVLAAMMREGEQAARRAERRARFDPGQHPRDSRGRFRPKGSTS